MNPLLTVAWAKLKRPAPILATAALLAVAWWIAPRSTARSHQDKNARPIAKAARHQDPDDPIARVLRIPDAELRHRHEVVLAAEIPSHEIPTVLTRLPAARLKSLYAATLADRWAAGNPAAASTWASSISDPQSRHILLATTAGAWADSAHDPAIAWAKLLANDEDREVALAAIVRATAICAPERSLELAAEMERPDLVHDCLRDWARLDPANATRRAMSLPEPRERTAILLDALTEWARLDQTQAADFAINEMTGDPHLDQAILVVISQGAPAHLPMLRQWVASFPDSPLKHSARAELTRIERLLPSAPASLPGEAHEERSPLAVAGP